MPPVFGPVSPSPMRLKSRAGASGSADTPSQSASTDSSTPSRNSSTTTGASPKRWPDEHVGQRRARLVLAGRDHDALARREPVGLQRDGIARDRGEPVLDGADDRVVGGRDAGRGHDLLGVGLRALELGGVGDRTERGGRPPPRSGRRSPRPAAPPARRRRGRCRRRRSPRGRRRRRTAPRRGRCPRCRASSSTSGDCGERSSARTIACSRPPPPMTRTFVTAPR